MIKFDDPQTLKAINAKRLYDKINYAFFTVFIVFLIVAAVCSHYFGELDVWFLCISGALLAAGVLYNVLFVYKAWRLLRREIARVIADGFYAEEEFLKGSEIAFDVSYTGNTLTVKRRGFCGRVAIDPAAVTQGAKLAANGGELNFDLTPLKAVPSVYSAVGTYLWDFFRAYYALNFEKGKYTDVRVTDNTGKRPYELAIVDDGDLIGGDAKNYFIKTGLVK